jgi:uncharacterized RDD family membrane protein YckC
MRRNIHSFALAALAAAVCVTASLALAKGTNRVAAGDQGGIDFTVVGNNYELKAGETAGEVAVVGGNATIAGRVKGNVAVVLGSLTLKPTAVIGDDIVVVGGSFHAASNAVVRGDVVVVAGCIEAEPGFKPGGEQVTLRWTELRPEWVRDWWNRGPMRGALLPWLKVGSWITVGVALLFNLLISLVFPRPLQRCYDMARGKPVQSFLFGLLLMAAFGPVCMLLAISCVGILAVPFLIFAVLVALVFGFIAVYRVLGQPLSRLGDGAQAGRPLLALAIGTVICNLAYMLPVVGFLVWGLVMTLGFGAAWLALISRKNREVPPAQPPPLVGVLPASAPPPPVVAPIVAPPPLAPPPAVPMAAAVSAPAAPPPVAPVSAPPVDVTTLPRAEFWPRIGAALLDCLLISALVAFCGFRHQVLFNDPWPTFLLLAYFIGLWTWRGTTIGCAICGLKIVRTDGQPVTFGVAIVRALASLLSLAVAGLGFFWIAWDREKQAWHDKVAGTLVVRMPKGVSLI